MVTMSNTALVPFAGAVARRAAPLNIDGFDSTGLVIPYPHTKLVIIQATRSVEKTFLLFSGQTYAIQRAVWGCKPLAFWATPGTQHYIKPMLDMMSTPLRVCLVAP
jgi:hypothetical protein